MARVPGEACGSQVLPSDFMFRLTKAEAEGYPCAMRDSAASV